MVSGSSPGSSPTQGIDMRRTRVRPATEPETVAAPALRRTRPAAQSKTGYALPEGAPDTKAWRDLLFICKCHSTPAPVTAKQLTKTPGAGGYYWWLSPNHVDDPMNPGKWSIVSWYKGWPHCRKNGFFIGPLVSPLSPYAGD